MRHNAAAVTSRPVFPRCLPRPADPGARWVLWLLIVALGVYACSGAVLRMLGPAHWHAPSRAAPAVVDGRHGDPLRPLRALLAGIHALSDRAHAQAHALGLAPHQHQRPHQHGGLLRHWHGAEDDTVRLAAGEASDPRLADLSAAAAFGSATLLSAVGTGPARPALSRANGRWPPQPALCWRSADAAPPAEPPIA